ncbi:TPA: hypothetical protein QIF36_004174 [Enterobacter kobei]|nr:hypothetical protein [Enterobacter kobei]
MSSQPELALSGRPLPLKNLEISVSMRLQDEDKSGQASGTASAQQGTKAKELQVKGIIPWEDEALLTQLYQMAEAEDSSGKRQRWRVNHPLATAIKMREATFSGDVSASKAGSLWAWQVSFTLREYISVAEKKAEARAGADSAGAVSQTAQGTSGASEAPEQLNAFEKVLKKINDTIGPYDTNKKGES